MNPPRTDARRHHDPQVRGFASDNYAGAHPEVLAALALANGGHQVAYGEDDYTDNLQSIIRSHFGATAEAFPVFNGTGANVVALQAVTDRWGAVICAESAHINVDEGGAPERMGGLKLLTVPTPDGKLTPELIDKQAYGWDDEHRAMPQVVSITQSTELGTLYTPEEIRAICEHAHAHGMKVHLDGSRIANAAASLDVPMRTFTNAV
ncbi:MAG: threonine aldolase, partial [Streptomyces sp.]|nr:threonine aldolase [Streptomyces sp.]